MRHAERAGLLALLLALSAATTRAQEVDRGEAERPPPGLDLRLVFEGYPGGILFSPNRGSFTARRGSQTERAYGFTSTMPQGRIGVGLETSLARFDLLAGGGGLITAFDPESSKLALHDFEILATPFVRADAIARFKVGEQLTIGPTFGVIHIFNPEWPGDIDVDFHDSTGFVAGVGMTLGIQEASVSLRVEYVHAIFDVDEVDGLPPAASRSDRELDMSGVLIELGFVLRF